MSLAAVPMIEPPEPHWMGLREVFASVVDLLNTAKRELDVNREAAKASISRASSLLSVEFNKDLERKAPDHKPRALLAWQLRRIDEYIEAHIGGRILVANLSAIVRRSEAHFARAFKRTLGVSPHAYLIRRRVEKATHLMLVSDASLTDIALMCGMTDQAHLCKIFRQSTGQTPAAWRRERRSMVAENWDRRDCSSAAA